MTELKIPRPEEESPELAKLLSRQEALIKRLTEISEQARAVHTTASAQQPIDVRKERLAALVEGVAYEPPASAQNQLAALAAERQDVDDAIRELSGPIMLERQKASRAIALSFSDHHRQVATEFFSALLAASKAHARMGEFHRDLRRSGVEPGPLVDYGRELFGAPLDRTNDAWIALRKAARDGFLKPSDIPEFAR